MKKFFKTIITIEILSEKKYNSTNLENIAYDITEGECSGKVDIQSFTELSAIDAVKELKLQGSSPEFFNLDERGNDLDDDIIGYQIRDRIGRRFLHPDITSPQYVYSWSQCETMMCDDTEFWQIVAIHEGEIDNAKLVYTGEPND